MFVFIIVLKFLMVILVMGVIWLLFEVINILFKWLYWFSVVLIICWVLVRLFGW